MNTLQLKEKVLEEKVDFSFLRYANCWEDAWVLTKALNVQAGEKVLSIASAGDNSFSLLLNDPSLVVAVDLSAVQLYLVELKKEAIRSLSRTAYLEFAGFTPCASRVKIFHSFKSNLSPAALLYWEHHSRLIENGIIFSGKFERYFFMFSKKILPWIHHKNRVQDLLEKKASEAQNSFYEKEWNTWKWRLFFKVFFSRYVMGRYGRDPEFLKEVKVPVGKFIFRQAEQHLRSTLCQENFILNFCLTGSFGEQLPHYVQPGIYEQVKKNIDKLTLYHGSAAAAIPRFGKFQKMNMSNIFEYMDKGTFSRTGADLERGLDEDGRIAYWNLMVPRRISDLRAGLSLSCNADELKKSDKGFFYGEFIVEQKSV
jgi:S-adenosylmethionine-diacylglycerol 3-amino-3-carboxypropyl transferase